MLETAILRQKQNYSSFWQQFTSETLSLSEQFLMSNDFGFNWYCDGGDEGMAF